MTEAQRLTVARLVSRGFEISSRSKEIVRLSKGADKQVVLSDGTIKRGHHVHYQSVRNV
jgi:exopolyphosphatase/pppGpp-phosphohydrolase